MKSIKEEELRLQEQEEKIMKELKEKEYRIKAKQLERDSRRNL